MTKPLRRLALAILLPAGPVSLFAWPLPSALAITLALLGGLSGALLAVFEGDEFAAVLSGGVLIFAVAVAPDAAQQLAPGLEFPWWEPAILALSASVWVQFLVAVIRHMVRRTRGL